MEPLIKSGEIPDNIHDYIKDMERINEKLNEENKGKDIELGEGEELIATAEEL